MTAPAVTGPVVVVGTGQAGLQAAVSLREAGYDGDVTLVGDEPDLPYQRPPLSKAYLAGKLAEEGLHLRQAAFLVAQRITLAVPERAVAIDRARRLVRLGSGAALPYAHLILATGTRSRRLPVPGSELPGVLYLRSLADARALKRRIGSVRRAVVIGAGFIGLEFASVAAERGIGVHVVEAAPRAMARAVSPETSAYFARRHAGRGVDLTFGASVTGISRDDGGGLAVHLAGGEPPPIAADLVLVGIGAVPNDELAAEAGLAVEDGIVVDEHLLTSDPCISSIGDCAAHPNPHAGAVARLESVQNAVDQARGVAARLTGRPAPYASVPWFWSDQGADKLQIAGLTAGSDRRIVCEEPDRLAVYCFRRGRFAGLETVNRPADHMLARRAIAVGSLPGPAEVAAEGFTLKSFLARREAPLAAA